MTLEQAILVAIPERDGCFCQWNTVEIPFGTGCSMRVYLWFNTLSNLTGVSVETFARRVEHNLLKHYSNEYMKAQCGGQRDPKLLELRNGYVLHAEGRDRCMHTSDHIVEMPLSRALMTLVPDEGAAVVAGCHDFYDVQMTLARRRVENRKEVLASCVKSVASAEERAAQAQRDLLAWKGYERRVRQDLLSDEQKLVVMTRNKPKTGETQ